MAADEKITVKIDGDDTGVRAKLAGLVGDAAKIGENFSKTFGAAFSDDFSQTVKTVVDTVSGLAGLMTSPWGIAVAAIGGVVLAVDALTQSHEELQQEIADVAQSINELGGKAQEAAEQQRSVSSIISQYENLSVKLASLNEGTAEYVTVSNELAAVQQMLIDNSNGLIAQSDAENGLIDEKIAKLEQQTQAERDAFAIRLEAQLLAANPEGMQDEADRLQGEIDKINELNAVRKTAHDTFTELAAAYDELESNLDISPDEYTAALGAVQKRADEAAYSIGGITANLGSLDEHAADANNQIISSNETLNEYDKQLDDVNGSIDSYNTNTELLARINVQKYFGDTAITVEGLNDALAAGDIEQAEYDAGLKLIEESSARVAAENENTAKTVQELTSKTEEYVSFSERVKQAASEQISANNELAAAIEKVKGGKALDAQETLNLISKYPELAKYYADTGDAAFLNGQKLIDLANASAESADVYMENERRKTETAIAETRERLAAYKLEAQAFMISAEGDSSALDIAIAEARALADLERKLDDINIAANLSALSMDDFNDSLNDSGGAGNAAAEAVNKLDEEYREKRKIIEDDVALGKQSTEDLAKFLEEQVEVTGLSAELKTEIAKELYKNAQEQAEKDRQLEEKNLEHQLAMGEITKADYMEMIQERLDSNREKIENEELTAEQQSAINDRIRTDEQALHDYQIELAEEISDLEYQQAQEEMALAEEISEAFIEGLRERYDEQRQMAEKDFEKLEAQAEDATNLTLDQLDAQIQATKDAKRDMLYAEDDYAAAVGDIINDGSRQRIDTFSAEYDKQIVYLEGIKALQEEINKVSDKYDADIAGYEDEIKNLEDLKEAEDEARRAEEELKRVLDLEDRIAEEEDPEKQAELEQQLYELLEEQRYRAWQKEVQDEIEWNREQIERLEEEKKTEIEALEEKQADLQETRVIWLDKEAAQMQEHYDRLMTAQNTHNELAKVNMETGMAVIVATITEFNPAYVEAGEGLGDSLIEGLASKLPEYQRILDSMLGARRDAEEELDELEAEREAELDFSAKSYVSLLPDGTGTLVIPKFTNVLAQNAIGSGIVQAVAAVASSLSRSPQTVIDRAAQSISKTHSPTVNAYFYGQQATSRQNIYDLRQMMERMAVDFD